MKRTEPLSPDEIRAADIALAHEYARDAGLHHRRALKARTEGRDDDAQKEIEIAQRFERRAQIKIAGSAMPAQLRTPTEGILRVDQFRRQIVDVLYLAADITQEEWIAFDHAIVAELDLRFEHSAPLPSPTDEPSRRLEVLRHMIATWGVTFGPPLTIGRADGGLETSAAGHVVTFLDPRLPADWPGGQPPVAKSPATPAPSEP